MIHDRGGVFIGTGKIGVVRCLRQQFMWPGETIKPMIDGKVKVETLRERDGVPLNVRMDVFLTPLRWLWDDYPTWVREGPSTNLSPPAGTVSHDLDLLGIGNVTITGTYRFWADALLRIYNEHYKHPENADLTAANLGVNDVALKAVPLPISWSRIRSSLEPDNSSDMAFTTPANRNFDVRVLREVEQRYVAAQKRENLTFERWVPMLREMYNASGSHEVDQIPFHIDQVEARIREREMPATDGPSLGKFQTLMDFDVRHRGKPISAGEHSILTYVMLCRYPSVAEDEGNPYHGRAAVPYEGLVGDHELLEAQRPEQVQYRHIFPRGTTGNVGYLPSGWRHRTRWNLVDDNVRSRQTFPIYNAMTSLAQTREASRVNVAFRSTALNDFLIDLDFNEQSYCMVPTAAQSIMSGMSGKGDSRMYHTPFVN